MQTMYFVLYNVNILYRRTKCYNSNERCRAFIAPLRMCINCRRCRSTEWPVAVCDGRHCARQQPGCMSSARPNSYYSGLFVRADGEQEEATHCDGRRFDRRWRQLECVSTWAVLRLCRAARRLHCSTRSRRALGKGKATRATRRDLTNVKL